MSPITKSVHCVIAVLIFITSQSSLAAETAPAAQKAATETARPPAEGAIQEVVVTARKREESLQEVPLSVVAISGEALEARSIENLEDLGQTTPNFRFAESPQNGRVGGIIFIRGVGQRDTISAYDPAVGLYVDGVYMGRMWGNNLDMLELERVEVLRGPQGTLFGKNTSGGAVNIITRQPDLSSDAFGGRAQLTGGSRNRLNALGSVNLPLIDDRMALQVAAARLKQDGYGHRIDGQDMANTDRSAARAQLLYRPSDRASALLSADWIDFDESNAATRLVATKPDIAGTLAVLNSATAERYDNRWVSSDEYFNNGTGPNSARGRLRGSALTLTYDTGPATLKSITAYRDLDVFNDQDPDGSPVTVLDQFQEVHQHQVSQELQAVGSAFADRLSWVVGAYYFSEKTQQFERYNFLPSLVPVLGFSFDFSRRSFIDNDSIAGYAQTTYSLTNRLRLTTGLRYTRDEKGVLSVQVNAPPRPAVLPPRGEHNSNAWSPRVGLDYQWTPAVMSYVSAAHGAKNGGFNGRVSRVTDFTEFGDEEVWTYETGVRSEFLDRRVRLNATAFYSEYKDMQLQISGSTVEGGVPRPFNIITNIPKANVHGGELELGASPIHGLMLSVGVGLTYGKYEELPTDAQFLAVNPITRDSQFSHAPETAVTLGAQYTRALSNGLIVTPRVDYSHQSKIYFNAENTARVTQPSYGLLNARVTFEHERSPFSVSFFGTNLTDESYIVGGFDDLANPSPGLGFTLVTQGAPREWGVSAQVRF